MESNLKYKDKKRSKAFPKKKKLVTEQTVRSMIKSSIVNNDELKYFLTNTSVLGGSSVTSSGIIQDFSLVTQGVADQQRVGDTFKYVNLEFNYNVIAADTTNVIRLVLLQYHPVSIPIAQTFFVGTLGNVNSPLQSFSKDIKPQFSVLWDKTHYLTLNNNACEGKHMTILPKRKIVQAVNGGTTGSEHIYLVAISDSSSTPYPTISFIGRINFTDA